MMIFYIVNNSLLQPQIHHMWHISCLYDTNILEEDFIDIARTG
ncbi:hypothetical protein LINGRAHAP2_LOCUS35732 [Linum grandiflorum]